MKNFKKLFAVLIFFIILSTTTFAHTFDVHVVADGKVLLMGEENGQVNFSRDVGFISSDRTFVPLRLIGESLKCDVNYDPSSKDINISDGISTNVKMNVNSKDFTVNGSKKSMDVNPILYNDRTYVPVRYIGEAFNREVKWDSANKTCHIGKGINYKNQDLSKYKKLDFSKYGFYLYVDEKYDQLIEASFESIIPGGIDFFEKSLHQKNGSGIISTVYLFNKPSTDTKDVNIYYENGKNLILMDHSSSLVSYKGNELVKYTKARDAFKDFIIVPSENHFKEFSLDKFKENKVANTKNKNVKTQGDYNIYTFGNPKVNVKVPNEIVNNLIIKNFPDRIEFYEASNHKDNNLEGWVLSVIQYNEKDFADFDVYDFVDKIYQKNGNIVTAIQGPRDVTYDFNNPKKTKLYKEMDKKLREGIIIEVAK
ncbi:copper amine oxidase N-terminal domain-containing protein [Peptoniphilus sp. MSJ-1]|uniref:Copper amine oxidase N-terminal domain-containing protein n=1 Tax=Peptoniphilus ovalis TaxID=2841503 RepID=A0ABS6FEA5_9FIRM|nr:copper amine oxidase N-terminal domain-containing protein [Peptoniphilus ovalis]MBU5668510.1 copper amine oxidase N-terminal domain-containing protein [Peptoniphilus ovalis]